MGSGLTRRSSAQLVGTRTGLADLGERNMAGVNLSVVPGQVDANGLTPVHISIRPPEEGARTPSDICCVIDISWSMTMEAKVAAGGESNGLSMLDIAKHAVRTVIHSLREQDRLSLVSFCRKAEVLMPLTAMDEAGRKAAEERLDELGFGNGTNLWNGLEKGLTALGAIPDDTGRFGHMILLTDGETEEKDSILQRLQDAKAKYGGRLPCTVNAFGFGYEIESRLLVNVAELGDGSYAFIPDAGFVGTIFVNCMGNLLVTMARDTALKIHGTDLHVKGGWAPTTTSEGDSLVSLGTLQYGQSRDVVLYTSQPSSVTAILEYGGTGTGLGRVVANLKEDGSDEAAKVAEIHRCRALFIDALAAAGAAAARIAQDGAEPPSESAFKEVRELILDVGKQVNSSHMASEEHIAGILEDIFGQATEAFKPDYWKKWGRHYTPSLMFAHKMQQCNNFKDPGVQLYGGKLFNEIRDDTDQIFDQLPAPKITPAMYRYLGNGKVITNPDHEPSGIRETHGRPAPAPAAPPVNMAAYNDRYGGCMDGASLAQLTSGDLRQVSELSKGDCVVCSGGREAEILCVVRTRCHSGRAPLVALPGGCRLTPHHPVFVDGTWRFPVDLGDVENVTCEAVYSFVLGGSPDLLVGGVPCIALGHGVEEGVAKHPYFGTDRVLQDLAALPGYALGLVDLPPGSVSRDSETGLVCGLQAVSVADQVFSR